MGVERSCQHTLAYAYDGSFDGLLCCVFDSFSRKESPAMLLSPRGERMALLPTHAVRTDPDHARRVLGAIPARICMDAMWCAQTGFLSCAPEIDLVILRFLRLGFRVGARVMDMLTEPSVNALNKAIQHATHEAHLLTGFIRFTDSGGALTAVISPKNRVLPLLADHFADRYPGELFMIYDRTHREALVHQHGKYGIFPLLTLELPELSGREQTLRALWKRFYDTIGIAERENPRCRMSHMPKRYWAHMPEMQDGLDEKTAVPGAPKPELWYNRGELPEG